MHDGCFPGDQTDNDHVHRLSLQLAKALNGEIINADSMQVYAGLPIMTNKPTPNELLSAPHHLLGHVDPLSREYSVPEFQKDALSVVCFLLMI